MLGYRGCGSTAAVILVSVLLLGRSDAVLTSNGSSGTASLTERF